MAQITFKGTPIITQGDLPKVGAPAPDFTLTKTDLSDVNLSDFKGKRGKANFVNKLIEEEIIYQEAIKKELQLDPEVKKKRRRAERSSTSTEPSSRFFLTLSSPYEASPTSFTSSFRNRSITSFSFTTS